MAPPLPQQWVTSHLPTQGPTHNPKYYPHCQEALPSTNPIAHQTQTRTPAISNRSSKQINWNRPWCPIPLLRQEVLSQSTAISVALQPLHSRESVRGLIVKLRIRYKRTTFSGADLGVCKRSDGFSSPLLGSHSDAAYKMQGKATMWHEFLVWSVCWLLFRSAADCLQEESSGCFSYVAYHHVSPYVVLPQNAQIPK